ncbi:hypothetical protein JCM1841_002115 [Sporobolomyces salmonicolor]
MPSDPRRRGLPLAFLRAADRDDPDAQAGADARDLAIAVDGSFVETTSEAAAKAMARFYREQARQAGRGAGGGDQVEYAVQKRIDKDGRSVYRIRPLSGLASSTDPAAPTASSSASPTSASSAPSSEGDLPFARPSNQPAPPPNFTPGSRPTIALHRSSPNRSPHALRQSRSIPLLRSEPTTAGGPSTSLAAETATSGSGSSFLHPHANPTPSERTLRRAGSTPSLRSPTALCGATVLAPRTSQSTVPSASSSRSPPPTTKRRNGSTEGDVLGRILGWRDGVDGASAATTGTGTGRGARRPGTARVPLPEMFRDAGSDGKGKGREVRKRSGTKGSQASLESRDSDRSDLPEDLEELSAALEVRDEAPDVVLDRPPFGRSVTSVLPFGAGVRIPRAGALASLQPPGAILGPSPRPLPANGPEPAHEHTMREVSSNDSIRTAKADDPRPPSRTRGGTPRRRFQDPAVFDVFHLQAPCSPPLSAPSLFGQHGRLPSTSSLASSESDASRATAHHITVTSAPGDDPRFVIWGYKDAPALPLALPASPLAPTTTRRPSLVPSTSSPSAGFSPELRRGSIAELEYHPSPSTSASGSPATTSSRRWSLSGRGGGRRDSASSPATSVRDSVGSGSGGAPVAPALPQRILMAATVERLVAELTSQISVELLSDFFLTYRHYLAPLDLLHLLLTRFSWAMSPASSPEDDALRRVVRVRTFVVLRYWLMNHFMDDFYPSREIRTGLTDWLNKSAREDRFRESQKDARLIKNLKKTVRRCKETFTVGGAPASTALGGAGGPGGTKSPVLGSSDEDVDLDLGDATAVAAARSAKSPPPSTSSFSFHSLRGKGKLAFSSTASGASTFPSPSSAAAAFPLPGAAQQNPLARSFTSALGTFGRFKRMLGHRASNAGMGGGGDEADAVEFEQNETGDLLWVRGGLDKYLEYWDIKREGEGEGNEEGGGDAPEVMVQGATPEIGGPEEESTTPKPGVIVEEQEQEQVVVDGPPSVQAGGVGLGILALEPSPFATVDYAFPSKPQPAPAASVPVPVLPIFDPDSYDSTASPFPFSAVSANPYGLPLPRSQRPVSARIELDDLDDSDDDDDDVVEVKRTLKRLPNAHNLRLVAAGAPPSRPRHSVESEMSYGFGGARLSYAGQERESVLFVDDEEGFDSAAVAVIPNFILEGLLDSDDDEEPGDVEAALRRLEGLVDDSREKEKAKKVERQMERSERLVMERKKGGVGAAAASIEAADGDKTAPTSRKLSLASKPSLASMAEDARDEPVDIQHQPPPVAVLGPVAPASREAAVVAAASTTVQPLPPPTPPRLQASQASQTSPLPPRLVAAVNKSPTKSRTLSRRPAYPSLASRKPTLSRIFGVSTRPLSARPSPSPSSASGLAPPAHRSFLLFCRTESLAQQFTLIERDMLRVLSYQELVSGSWRDRIAETDVLDWEAYLKERRKEDLKAKQRGEQTMSAVQDVIARFNLMANWVCSEILLTASIDERAVLIAKFIRLAFKCYCHSNFQTLTQIVHGLQIRDVERLGKTWAKVPSWEMRKFRGMQVFVSHLKNFKYLRELTNALVADYAPAGDRSSALDSMSAAAAKGCIPFVGLFLRDLAINAELPTFLDPTSPNSPASVDASGSLTVVADPNAFVSLPPLPGDMPLRPLVNVHKFRKLATIVQRVRAFQQLADKYPYEPTPSVYFKCLKIRCLEQSVMHEVSARLEA